MSRDYPSHEEQLVSALERIADALEYFVAAPAGPAPAEPPIWRHATYQGGPEGAHHPYSTFGPSNEAGLAAAEIVYGCYCQGCAYWRGRLQ